jgi:hypothetical protein
MFQRVGSQATEAVFYWWERVPLKFGSQFESRNVLISIWANTDVLTNSGVLRSPDDSENIKKLYFSLSAPIADYWEQQSATLNSSELLYTFFSQNATVLLFLAVLPFVGYIMYFARHKSLVSGRMLKAYQRLNAMDKTFVDSFLPTNERSKYLYGHNAVANYLMTPGPRFSEERLLSTLKTARNTGLVNDMVISVKDEPRLVWKPAFPQVSKKNTQNSMKSYLGKLKRIRIW